jgi:hypothetical protein
LLRITILGSGTKLSNLSTVSATNLSDRTTRPSSRQPASNVWPTSTATSTTTTNLLNNNINKFTQQQQKRIY